jgi:hypothetical protein
MIYSIYLSRYQKFFLDKTKKKQEIVEYMVNKKR